MKLKILSGKRKGEVIPLGTQRLMIGSDRQKNNLVLPDPKIKPQQAHLFKNDQGRFFLKNMDPDSPVYVNGKKHHHTLNLEPGMKIQIGDTRLEVQINSPPLPPPPPPRQPQGCRFRFLSLLLGLGVGIFILVLVLLFISNDSFTFGLTEQEIEARNTAIALASATVTPTPTATATATATQTPIPPTATLTPTAEPTATLAPTPTPLPILQPQLGEISQEIYTPQLLDPNLLDQQEVTWDRDILMSVPMSFTNNGEQPININEIQVGLFASPRGEREQVPSFALQNQEGDLTLEPGETQTLRWQVVLPQNVPLEAWAVRFADIPPMQEFIDP